MAKRRVVLTGAAGYVAQRMFRELDERWELVPIDVRDTTADGKPIRGAVVADLTGPDRDAYRAHFRTGSFTAMGIIQEKSRGLMVADLVALIASLDVVAPEIDR